MRLPKPLQFLEHEIIRHLVIILSALLFLTIAISSYLHINLIQELNNARAQLLTTNHDEAQMRTQLVQVNKQLEDLKNVDQKKRNDTLEEEITNIQTNYKKAESTFETLSDFKVQTKKDWSDLDKEFAQSLKYLEDKNYASASAQLDALNKDIQTEKDKIVASMQPPAAPAQLANVAVNNAPPGSGYSRQSVQTSRGTFTIDIVAADLGSNKVIVDTASSSDCSNNCPVLPLASYVSRNGAWAGINGSFFCPTAYPSCAGKTNSFDTLLMNKNKTYFNSGNNVYSTIPAAIFSSSARFVAKSLEWGRDTSPDSVIANYPLLVQNGANVYSTMAGEPKFAQKGARTFLANKGNTAYIGVIYNATMDDSAVVMQTLGMNNALNLDEGGSTAFWANGGYRAGPGRDIPNAVLIVKR